MSNEYANLPRDSVWRSAELAPAPSYEQTPYGSEAKKHSKRGRLLAKLAPLGVLLAKLKTVLLFVAKLKFAVFFISVFASIGSYMIWFGWPFAVGIVALLFVHEMGHYLEMRRQHLNPPAPVFIPFFGAAIFMRTLPSNVLAEAKLAAAGPIVGSLGALATVGLALLFHSQLLMGLAVVGFLVNLFNLLPISPLDGGRMTAAMHPLFWVLGIIGALAYFSYIQNWGVLAMLVTFSLASLLRLKDHKRNPGYYALRLRTRVIVGLCFAALTLSVTAGLLLTKAQMRSFERQQSLKAFTVKLTNSSDQSQLQTIVAGENLSHNRWRALYYRFRTVPAHGRATVNLRSLMAARPHGSYTLWVLTYSAATKRETISKQESFRL